MLYCKNKQKIVCKSKYLDDYKGAGIQYTEYEADEKLPSGFRFLRNLSNPKFPIAGSNDKTFCSGYEAYLKEIGRPLVLGRPKNKKQITILI